jgi:hypothetical protein
VILLLLLLLLLLVQLPLLLPPLFPLLFKVEAQAFGSSNALPKPLNQPRPAVATSKRSQTSGKWPTRRTCWVSGVGSEQSVAIQQAELHHQHCTRVAALEPEQ